MPAFDGESHVASRHEGGQSPDKTTRDRFATNTAQELLAAAAAPVVVVGVGARRAAGAVGAALARLSCPVLPTYKAKGIVAESSPSAAGLLTGATIEAPVLRSADLIVAVGFDPVEMIPGPWPYEAPVVSLSEWPTGARLPRARRRARGAARGDDRPARAARAPPPRARAAASTCAPPSPPSRYPPTGLAPHEVVRETRAAFPAGTVATVDSGAHMLVAMAHWLVERPGEALISSGLATMGFALPAAVGAAFATSARVVCFTGDGGLGMALAELETLVPARPPGDGRRLRRRGAEPDRGQAGAGQGGEERRPLRTGRLRRSRARDGLRGGRADTVAALHEQLAIAAAARGPYLVDALVDASGYRAVVDAVRGGSR